MMDLTPVVTRLNEIPELAGRVSLIADFEGMDSFVGQNATAGGPSAAVVGPYERAERREVLGGCSQQVNVQFDVVCCVRYTGKRPTGLAQLNAIRALVTAKLFGWAPASRTGKCQVAQNNPLVDKASLIAWHDRFSTYYRLEA